MEEPQQQMQSPFEASTDKSACTLNDASADLRFVEEELSAALRAKPASAAENSRCSSSASGGMQSGSGTVSNHPNIFVRGLPLTWSELEITGLFQKFGTLTSLRLVRHSVTKQSLGYGFVRFQDVSEAQTAINSLNGTTILGQLLQVKFADADAGPPMSSSSGTTPSDSCYVKHLPLHYGANEVRQLFEACGIVMDVKMFPCVDRYKGVSALVRMSSIEAAEQSIAMLNNINPPGGTNSLVVRFAESPTEKAARLKRKEKQQRALDHLGLQKSLSESLGGIDAAQLQKALSALNIQGMALPNATAAGHSSLIRSASSGGINSYSPAVLSSVCVKGLPPNTDRLWMYEHFARFGAIAGMRILIDESSGLCNGTGFINFADAFGAERAKQAMSGLQVGDRILHVMIQQQGARADSTTSNSSSTIVGESGAANPKVLYTDFPAATLPLPSQNEWQRLLQQNNAALHQGGVNPPW